MGKRGKAAKKAEAQGRPPEAWVLPSVVVVSAVVLVTAATTDQWRGAFMTEIQILVVGAAAWWGLRR
ncbi:MAG: hypothetical protein VCC00_13555 [Deltaproteobacteria bacterium]